ncbi:hypothetical protein MMC13_005586 [Lambiella insularis]|nr:hypothetical protein [Lambiella insularis]
MLFKKWQKFYHDPQSCNFKSPPQTFEIPPEIFNATIAGIQHEDSELDAFVEKELNYTYDPITQFGKIRHRHQALHDQCKTVFSELLARQLHRMTPDEYPEAVMSFVQHILTRVECGVEGACGGAQAVIPDVSFGQAQADYPSFFIEAAISQSAEDAITKIRNEYMPIKGAQAGIVIDIPYPPENNAGPIQIWLIEKQFNESTGKWTVATVRDPWIITENSTKFIQFPLWQFGPDIMSEGWSDAELAICVQVKVSELGTGLQTSIKQYNEQHEPLERDEIEQQDVFIIRRTRGNRPLTTRFEP